MGRGYRALASDVPRIHPLPVRQRFAATRAVAPLFVLAALTRGRDAGWVLPLCSAFRDKLQRFSLLGTGVA